MQLRKGQSVLGCWCKDLSQFVPTRVNYEAQPHIDNSDWVMLTGKQQRFTLDKQHQILDDLFEKVTIQVRGCLEQTADLLSSRLPPPLLCSVRPEAYLVFCLHVIARPDPLPLDDRSNSHRSKVK